MIDTLVVGLDGYPYQRMKEKHECFSDLFPYLNRITTYTHTVPSLSAVLTGKPPEHHSWHYDKQGKDKKLFSHKQIKHPLLWQTLTELNKSQFWIGCSLVTEVEPVTGIMFGGYATQGPLVSPSWLQKEIGDTSIVHAGETKEQMLRNLHWIFETTEKFKRISWNLMFVYVCTADAIHHHLGTADDVMAILDQRLLRFLETVKYKTGIIFSDHGNLSSDKRIHIPEGILLTTRKERAKHILDVYQLIVGSVTSTSNRSIEPVPFFSTIRNRLKRLGYI